MMINKSSTMSTNISRDPAEARMKPSTPPHEYPSPCLTPSATGDQTVPIRARRIFLLSPANIRGIRGSRIMNDGMHSGMAVRLRNHGVPLGQIFSFISGLYFRGKLAYAEKFAEVAGDVRAAYVITSSAGLIPCERLLLLSGSAKFLRAKLIAQMKNTEVLSTAIRRRSLSWSEQTASLDYS